MTTPQHLSSAPIPVRITPAMQHRPHKETRGEVLSNLTRIKVYPTALRITVPHLTLCFLNVRSLKSKSADFVEYVTHIKADLIALTETGLVY